MQRILSSTGVRADPCACENGRLFTVPLAGFRACPAQRMVPVPQLARHVSRQGELFQRAGLNRCAGGPGTGAVEGPVPHLHHLYRGVGSLLRQRFLRRFRHQAGLRYVGQSRRRAGSLRRRSGAGRRDRPRYGTAVHWRQYGGVADGVRRAAGGDLGLGAVQASDDIPTQLGDRNEASIASALGFLNGQACTPIALAADGTTTARSRDRRRLLEPRRPTVAQREVPGLF